MAYIHIPSFAKKGSFTEDTEFVIVVDGVEYLITYKTLSDTFGNTPELLQEINAEIEALRNIVDAFPSENPAAPIALKIADTPTIDGIYKPTETGVYPNAGGLEYDPTEGITYFIRTQGVWTKDVTPINFTPTGVVEEGNTQAVSGGEVYDKVPVKEAVGIKTISVGQNLVSEYTPESVTDTSLWVRGYYHKTTGLPVDVNMGYRSKKLIKVKGGVNYNYNFRLSGNIGVCFYDENLNLIQTISTESTSNIPVTGDITLDISVVYMGLSFSGNTSTVFNNYFNSNSAYDETTSDIFITNDGTGLNVIRDISKQQTDANLENRDVEDTPVGVNVIQELVNSDINDQSLWGIGHLREDGTVAVDSTWRYSVKYYKLKPGTYDYQLYFVNNAKCLIYDTNQVITQVLSHTGNDSATGFFTVSEDSLIRISFRHATEVEPERISNIFVKNTTVLTTRILTEENYKDFVQEGNAAIRNVFLDSFSAKKRTPIVTFISDDGHINDKNWYIPLLSEYGVKSTLAISKHWVEGAEDGTFTNRLNRADVINYHNLGHDIANHTVNHLRFNEITADEAENEVMENKIYLEALISDKVPVFVSPFGIRTASLDKMISKYHVANFISGYGVRNLTPIDNYFMNRVSFDTVDNNVLLWDSVLQPALNSCLANSDWLIFAIHPGYSSYSPSNPVYMERRNELRQIIDFCNTNGIQIMTARGGYDYWKNHVNIGVRRADENYYQLGMDMTELNVNYFK